MALEESPCVVWSTYGHRFCHQRSRRRIGLAHAQFETIHPFFDGNGRVGRQLLTLLLMRYHTLHRSVLYLSHYLKARRTEYYRRLQAVRDEGAWEHWPAFFLAGVSAVARESAEPAGR